MSNPATDLSTLRPEQKRALLEQLLRERARKPKNLPLSSAQKRLWFLDKLEPGGAVYNVPTVLRLKGELNAEALRQGLNTIVERHEALRTVFEAADDAPFQTIRPPSPVEFSVIDLSELQEGQRQARCQNIVSREIRRPFDLARDLMVRAMLLRLGKDEHVLVLTTHHIASDEWSLRLLLKEWAECYAALEQKRQPALPELPIQYADYALWQQEWLRGSQCEAQLAYWKEQLSGAPVLHLPLDYPRPAQQTTGGDICQAIFPGDLMARVKEFSARHQATPFMTLLAVFDALLHRYTHQEDIVVGCPIAGRNRAESEPLIGFFVNTLALRARVDSNTTFEELVRRVRETTLGAYANQDLPFDRVVEELHPQRGSNHMPLVQVVFSLNNEFVDREVFPGIQTEEIETSNGTAKFDLTFVAKETAKGLSVVAEYNCDLFKRDRIERMLGHFQMLLQSALENPSVRIGDLELLTSEERDRILAEWNDTRRNYPREQSVPQIFEKQVSLTPDAVAAQYGKETITYRELNARANQLAHYLAAQRLGEGSLAGVYMDRSIDMIVAFLAILKAGAAYVPLDLSYPTERLAFMIADTRMPLILTDSAHAGNLPDSAESGANVIRLDLERANIQSQPRQLPPNKTAGDSLAYVIYTSGSTGQPKGVPIPHRGITRLVLNTDYVQIQTTDRIAQASNASFDAATFEIWGALLNGARVVGIPRNTTLSPSDFAAALRSERISILFLTTALFNQLAREAPGAFATLGTVLFGGEAVDPKWVRAVIESGAPERLLHVYGPTENTTFSTWHLVTDVDEEDSTVPIGKPIANSSLYILDPAGHPVPAGIAGEIHVGGDGLAAGYWQRPELSAERFTPNRFRPVRAPGLQVAEPGALLYRTGDLGRFDSDGNVEFLGRVDHQVKLRGFRIELGEIESLLARHEHVANCVVMLREDVPGDKRLVAYVIPKGEAPDIAELRAHLRTQLPDYMLPSAFVFMESFPLTPNEKIDRKALPVPDQKRSMLNKSFIAPRDAIEQQLTKIWEKVLGVQPIGIADNFFELGGHSLLAVRVFAQIEKILNKKLPLATLFRAPTVEGMAAILREENQTKSWSTIVEIQPKGSKPPFYWIHTLGGDGGGGFFYYRKLAELLGPDQPSFGIRSPQEPFSKIDEMARFYVKEIRKFQAEGPYYLGGFCFGGNVAYEMARQLKDAGEEVGLLVMLETSPPNVSHKQSWSATAAKYSIENLVENAKDFVSHSPQQRLTMLKNKSRRLKEKIRGKTASGGGDERKPMGLGEVIDLSHYPEGYVKYAETHWQELTEYQPGPYEGEVTLFRAKKQGLSNFNHTLGWDALVGDRVNVTVIPGTHESMLQEPNVQIVAAKLRALLEESAEPAEINSESELLAAS
jgi:amino acid adenylation domain-containing protein